MDIQPLFTHVDTGIDCRRRVRFGQYLALHAGLAPHHLFRTNARTNGPCSTAVRAKGCTVPSVHSPADGHPPGRTAILHQIAAFPTCKGCSSLAMTVHRPAPLNRLGFAEPPPLKNGGEDSTFGSEATHSKP
jgi:hypothetical protein